MIITEEGCECLGLIYGDGCLKKGISFANTCPELVTKVYRFLINLGTEKGKISIRFQTYSDTTEISDEELIEYWKQYVPGASYENFRKITRKERTTKNLRKRKKPNKEGLVEIAVYNKHLGKKLEKVILAFKDKDNKKVIAFLRGMIAAEGSIKLNEQNVLREIRISTTKEKEQKYIKEILKKLKIKANKTRYKFYISITGFERFKIFDQYHLCSLHPSKQRDFVTGFKNLKTRLSLY